jgi:hypothetical protein
MTIRKALGSVTVTISVGATTLAAQSHPMFPAPRFAAGDGVFGAAVADYDGDAVPDVVTSNSTADTIALLRGVGDASFLPPVVVGTAARPLGIAAGDVNGDGRADFVVANADADSVTVHLGHGNSVFDAGLVVPVGQTPQPVELADVNGDTRLDLLVGNYDDGTVECLLGDGAGGFATSAVVHTGRWPVGIAVADVNGDGAVDFAVANTLDANVMVALNTGHGHFAAPVEYPEIAAVDSVAIGNFDADLLPDLAYSVNWQLELRHGVGGGAFGPAAPLAANFGYAVRALDIDADGDTDLAGGALTTLFNQGGGVFSTVKVAGLGPMASDDDFSDLDGDGVMDVVTVLWGDPVNDIGASRGLGGGLFDVSSQITTPENGRPLFADIDGDGHLDLILASTEADPNSVSVRPGTGDGSFGPPVTSVAIDFFPVAVADLDGDRDPDLVGVGPTHTIRVALGNGDLTFTPTAQSFPLAIGLRDQLVADVSGDDVLDLVIGQTIHEIDIYIGNGDGSFSSTPHQAFSVPTFNDIQAGDIDDDGLVDLVFGCTAADGCSAALGTGGGSFSLPASSSAPGATSAMVLRDFDGDGELDLAVSSSNSLPDFALRVFAGQGNGSFVAVQELVPKQWIRYLESADMDLDGHADLVATSLSEPILVVVPGTGTVAFGAPRVFNLTSWGEYPGLGDLDENGRIDVAMRMEPNSTTLLFNRPPGPWALVGPGLAGAAGEPLLKGSGSLVGGEPLTLALTSGASFAPTWMVVGLSSLDAPFKGGILVPAADVLLGPFPTNPVGALVLSSTWPSGFPHGISIWMQDWLADAAGPAGFAASNGLRATTP